MMGLRSSTRATRQIVTRSTMVQSQSFRVLLLLSPVEPWLTFHIYRRDLVAEIVAAAKETQPQLHNGVGVPFLTTLLSLGARSSCLYMLQLYFSLPEWFNPSFAKYGHADAGDDLYHRRSDVPGTVSLVHLSTMAYEDC